MSDAGKTLVHLSDCHTSSVFSTFLSIGAMMEGHQKTFHQEISHAVGHGSRSRTAQEVA